MVTSYKRPANAAEALALAKTGARFLAGGTQLLGAEFRSVDFEALDLGAFMGKAIKRRSGGVELEALATFEDILGSPLAPPALKEAARFMASRNVRARATLGGNIAARKSCANLVPALLCLDAYLVLAGRSEPLPLAAWLAAPEGLICSVLVDDEKTGRGWACERWSRTAVDVSIVSLCVSLRAEGGLCREARVAGGGLGPQGRRLPALEAILEGKPLPSGEALALAASPFLEPKDDQRGSAALKRRIAATLFADAARRAYARAEGGEPEAVL